MFCVCKLGHAYAVNCNVAQACVATNLHRTKLVSSGRTSERVDTVNNEENDGKLVKIEA